MSDKLKRAFNLYKYPLIVIILGLTLMLLPSKSTAATMESSDESALLQETLGVISGVGETKALVSENGVVIVCEGADKASVKLDIINAVKSYTGFSADKICVLKISK